MKPYLIAITIVSTFLISACGMPPAASAAQSCTSSVIASTTTEPCLTAERAILAAYVQDHGEISCSVGTYTFESLVLEVPITPGPQFTNYYAYSQSVLAANKTVICSNSCISAGTVRTFICGF